MSRAAGTLCLAFLLSLLGLPAVLAAEPHYLVDNFSSALPDAPGVTFTVDTINPKVGSAALKAEYQLSADKRPLDFQVPGDRWVLPAAGKIVFWLKGDGSTNELQFTMTTGQSKVEADDRRSIVNGKSIDLPPVKLDSTEWKEITLDASEAIPADNMRRLTHMRIVPPAPVVLKKGETAPPVKLEGTIVLDDLRVQPAAGAAPLTSTVSAALPGAIVRDFTSDVPILLDVRNFTAKGAKFKVQLSLADRDKKPIANHDFDLEIGANQAKEFKLALTAQDIATFAPPFHVTGKISSTDLPSLAGPIDVNVAMKAPSPYYLVDNCSSPLPDAAGLDFAVDTAHPLVGLGALKIAYALRGFNRGIDYSVPEQRWSLGAAGKLVFWLKGDGSGNELQFMAMTAQPKVEADGHKSYVNGKNTELPRVKLDSTDWKLITLDVSEPIPAESIRWIARMRVYPPQAGGRRGEPAPGKSDGTIELDDMRIEPAAGPSLPTTAVSATLLGPAMRDFTSEFPISVDVRNFTGNSAKIKVRLSMVDRDQVPVADRDFDLTIGANLSNEFKLDLAPENIGNYLPPFHITGDVISTDLPSLAARIDLNVVMCNCRILFDNLGDVNGRWLTRGYIPAPGRIHPIADDLRTWNQWTMGEAYRTVPWTQTTTRLTRVAIDRPANTDPKSFPPDRFAMKFDYAGDSAAYTTFKKYIPGDAFRFGIWVKGDGSNNLLMGNFLDYSDLSDFWYGGWKRTWESTRDICRLNFTGWRYFEVPLPGNGIGTHSVRGSTDGIDFPIELTALVVIPEATPARRDFPGLARIPTAISIGASAVSGGGGTIGAQFGTILIGPMFADTQEHQRATLAAMIAYDNPYLDYRPQDGATVSIQNAWRTGSRKVAVTWTLTDKEYKEDGDKSVIASESVDLDIPAGEIRTFRIELASHARAIAPRAGPLRLKVTALDKQDKSTSTEAEIDLAKPDSVVLLADFESDRGYLGTKAEGITNAPLKGEPAAHTTTAQHHSGKRSLEITWDNEKNDTRFVAIDPPIPGISIDVTLWVKGDGSGALFYPIIGGPPGVRAGLGTHTWNLFLPRVVGGDLQDAVRLDFTDWRQFTFHFPPVEPNFDKPLPVMAFYPAYPQGLHLAVDARHAIGVSGSVFVDDIVIRTHLDPANRLALAIRRDSESNVILPNAQITFVASNYDAAARRSATISGGVFNWRGDCVAPLNATVDLAPAEARDVVLKQQLPPGAYELRVQMNEGPRIIGVVTQDLLVADMEKILGVEWQDALKDEWKLRVPIRDTYTYLDEDWDWVEFYPGNAQMDTMRNRFMQAKTNGAKPWMLLGFSAVWASSTKYEQMKAGALDRGYRDVGHGTDIFHVPERDADWDDYILEVMRGVGKDISGWVLWDNPDGTSTVSMPPKRLGKLIRISDKWRRVYCPNTPLIIGGMSQATATPYLLELAKDIDEDDKDSGHEKKSALSHISGVNVKMDVGRMSPEDAQILPYANLLRQTLAHGGKDSTLVVLTELDWAVEKSAEGLNVFDQAAYLARSDLLLSRAGIQPPLNIINEDRDRIGTGLAYRAELNIPPMTEKTATYNLKPAWWAMVRTRNLLSQLDSVDQIAVEDLIPQRTQAVLFKRKADGNAVVIVWRNNDPGAVSFAHTGLAVESAEDVFGAGLPGKEGWYSIGKVPVVFNLGAPASSARQGLARMWVRDGTEAAWPQRVIAQFDVDAAGSGAYKAVGATPVTLTGRTPTGEVLNAHGVAFTSGGSETLTLDTPAGAGLILRKRYRLDDVGQSATVTVNGKPAGIWDLKRAELDKQLSTGIREAVYPIDAALLAGSPSSHIEIKYDGPANTIAWTALEYRGGDFPLPALGPIYADQSVGPIRLGRNMIGGPLKIDTETFSSGIGAYANSILEYPINGQFKRFTAKVGVDAATEGRGSVIFEVYADGKKIWSSGIMSGLDRAKTIDVDVTGAKRLRLILNDAGDGNKSDAGDWCEPALKR